jgi:hypothetical protein
MADSSTIISSGQVLEALLAGGILGLAGQGIRSVAGLKKMNDEANSSGKKPIDLFEPSRFLVSLLIGFIAGVLATLGIGLSKLTAFDLSQPGVLVGIILAGYSGTDFIEAIASNLLSKSTPAADKLTLQRATGNSAERQFELSPPAVERRVVEANSSVTFGSLLPGGFYSSNPNDVHVHRSIRTNNPGALNLSSWQKNRSGYAGFTQPDNSPSRNVTTIYRTPEHGVASWYHLLVGIYGFSPGTPFGLPQLAQKYAGKGASDSDVQAYIAGWVKWANSALSRGTMIDLANLDQARLLAKAVFSHEAAGPTPLHDDQITFAINHERDGTLPS